MFAVWLRNWHICSTIFSAIAFFKCVCRFEGVANVHICSDVSKLSLTLLCVILVWYNMRNHVSQHLALTLQSIQPFSRLFNRSAVYSTVRQSIQPFRRLFNRSAVYSTVRPSIQPFGSLFNRSAVYSTVRQSIQPFGRLFDRFGRLFDRFLARAAGFPSNCSPIAPRGTTFFLFFDLLAWTKEIII